MAAISGKTTNLAFDISELADTYGTAEAVTAKTVVDSFSWSENPEELIDEGIGSGGFLATNALAANQKPTISIAGKIGYNNGFPHILAQFFGTAGTPTEQTVSEGDYLHQILFNATMNRVWLTYAIESSSTTVLEFPSCTTRSLTITAQNPTNFVTYSAEMLANKVVTSSPTNNNAAIQAVSVTDSEVAKLTTSDEWRINAQAGGSLSTSDKVAIQSWVLTLSRPQEFINEIRGASGNSTPNETGSVEGTLQVQLKNHADNTWEAAAQAGTEYKSTLHFDGTQIAGGVNKKYTFFLPRMVPIQTPQYNLTSPGANPTVVTFRLLDATAAPTGMSSAYPYVEVINERTSAYVA